MGKKSDRTKRILAKALQSLLTDTPLSKVTVTAVARKAGVDRQTFYYHFETMDELVAYLFREALVPLSVNVAECASARLLLHDDATEALLAQARELAGRGTAAPTEDDLDFAVEYCLMASASVLADWVTGARVCAQEELSGRLCTAFEQHIAGVVLFAQRSATHPAS